MTFASSAWAIDGAAANARLARVASYQVGGDAEGVTLFGDLKVSPLASPGPGFLVSAGAARVLNRYQSSPNQVYTVYNDATVTIGSSSMPAVNPSATSHLVCVVVGDKEFSQVGHPFMLATDPPAGQEQTFQYVRIVVIPNVPSTTTSFAQLNKSYPGYALARIDLAAGATWVTSSNVVDLRSIAIPRVRESMFDSATSSGNQLGNVPGTYENWPSTSSWLVDIPSWGTNANIDGWVEGALKTAAGWGGLVIILQDPANSATIVSTPATNFNEPAPAGASDRVGYNVGGAVSIPSAYRGKTVRIRFQGKVNDAASKFCLSTDASTGSHARIRFEEKAI